MGLVNLLSQNSSKKGKYQLRAELEQIPGGRFAFTGAEGSPQEQQGDVSARFVKEVIKFS